PGPLDAWQVWVGSEPPPIVRVRQPEWFGAHCFRQIGLRTDYRPAQPPPGPATQPYPKDGLAISPPRVVERVDIVPTGGAPAAVECDRYDVHYLLPLGVLRLSDRLFWLAQWSGWGYEEYSVVEIKRDKTDVVAHRWGGGC